MSPKTLFSPELNFLLSTYYTAAHPEPHRPNRRHLRFPQSPLPFEFHSATEALGLFLEIFTSITSMGLRWGDLPSRSLQRQAESQGWRPVGHPARPWKVSAAPALAGEGCGDRDAQKTGDGRETKSQSGTEAESERDREQVRCGGREWAVTRQGPWPGPHGNSCGL